MKLELGDCVIVNKGIKDPDLEEFEISGWQGRIVEIDANFDKDNILVTIEWDSLTLEQIPLKYIEQSEKDGFDWQIMTLFDSELKKTKPRDKKENVKLVQDKLSYKHQWAWLGDEGIRISRVLDNINLDDEMKCLQRWVEFLDTELTYPIQAIVSDSEDNRLIKSGDKVLIKSLPHILEMYGIIASIRLNGKNYKFPLCDLAAIDTTKSEFQLIDDYRTWFANR